MILVLPQAELGGFTAQCVYDRRGTFSSPWAEAWLTGCGMLLLEKGEGHLWNTAWTQSEEGSECEVVRELGHLEWTLGVIEKPLELTPCPLVPLGLLPLQDSGGH